LKRLQLYRGSMTVVGFAYHNTPKEGAKSKGESEELGRSESNTDGCGHYCNRKQLARVGACDALEQPW
jgi:hypothetical protein